MVGLSLNVLLGYLGQLSLGHQGLVGCGALFAAYSATRLELPFPLAVIIGAASGAGSALLIGFAALRIRGLYLALVTLVFGLILESSLFQASAFTGGGAGQAANRPTMLLSAARFYELCLAVVIVLLYLDWRLVRSKAGRALLTIKEDERAAAAFGIDVVGYKLLAFTVSGVVAGLAGGLFAFANQQFNGNDFTFPLALTFVLMTVVGGAGSRAGVVMGSVLFALLHTWLATFGLFRSFASLFSGPLHDNVVQFGPDVIGSVLLVLTVLFNPEGLARVIDPLVRWTGATSGARAAR